MKEKPQRKRLSVKAVNEILKAHGIESTGGREVSQCLRAGIMRNKVKLLKPEDDPENNYGLDQVRIVIVEKETYSPSLTDSSGW